MRRLGAAASAAAAAAAATVAGVLAYRRVIGGQLTLDTGLGRTVRGLGPILVDIGARQDIVFDVIAGPYLGRTPRAMADKLEVIERGTDMVLAAHHTPVGGRVATTLETVRFQRPNRIDFRLVRGPVPHVVEHFALQTMPGGTRLEYGGELGTDWWAAGRWWGEQVAQKWEAAVRSSLDGIKAEAERLAAVKRAD